VSRPRPGLDELWKGIGAIGLFAVIAAATVSAEFPAPADPSPLTGENITEGIGNALFNFAGPAWHGEGFLAAFIIVAVVLDVALDSSLLLAKRDEGDDE
jgi:NADH-quinone oxidoreductase subunit J